MALHESYGIRSTSTGALQTMSSSKSGVQTLSEKPPEPHRSSEDYLRVSTAFLNKNLRTLQEFAPQLDPSGGEAKTYDELLQCVNGGASVDFFEDIEAMNEALSLPRLFIKIYMYIQRGNLYHLFGDHDNGIADLTKARLMLVQGRNSNALSDAHCQNLESRIKLVQANIIRVRDGWDSEELEDLLQALEYTAVQDDGLRRYARFQRVTRILHLAYAERKSKASRDDEGSYVLLLE